MGGNTGKVKTDRRKKWLEAYRTGKPWGEPHQWRLEELMFIKLELQTFFADVEKNQVPEDKLKRITHLRSQIPSDLYSKPLIKKWNGNWIPGKLKYINTLSRQTDGMV